ncbi:MAG: hypothetical protein Q8M11_16830 [Sulfuritalea sp.]|nr:hypothetical protein [Sulfuritalea sp.]MDP1981818.1 hypothetical protein [Sulfuritalea sp.]
MGNVKKRWPTYFLFVGGGLIGAIYSYSPFSVPQNWALGILLWLLTAAAVTGCLLWGTDKAQTAFWAILNVAVPLFFIMAPVIYAGFLDIPNNNKSWWLENAFFPSQSSLWVFISTMFVVVLAEIEKRLAETDGANPERWLWHVYGAICLFIALAGAVIYNSSSTALASQIPEPQKWILAVFSLGAATSLPGVALWFVGRINQLQQEVVYS